MITRTELLQDEERLRRKAAGVLIGLAVGDALGDLGRSDAYRQRYGIITNLYDGAAGTDDTEFAVLTARALLDCGGDLTPTAMLAAWQKYILAQGGVFERAGRPLYGAVENIRRGMKPPLSGLDNVLNIDDGAAMRIAPVGIFCAGDPGRAARMAAVEAQISHAKDGIWAAQAVAASIAVAMADGNTQEVIDAGLACIPDDSWLGRGMASAMAICDDANDVMEAAWERLHVDLWTPAHAVSPEAIPQLYAIYRLTDGDFRRGLFWAGNFGRDADTLTAIIGALAGARYGVGIMPPEWVAVVRRPAGVSLKFAAQEDLLALADDLVNLIYAGAG